MIIRLSQKLARKINVSKLKAMPADTNPLADWSAHLFTADRTQYIILSNTQSLYSCLLFGRGITDDCDFIDRTLSTLSEFMEGDGQSSTYQNYVAPSTTTVSFAKALNRSVTGSMSDLVQGAKLYLEDDLSPYDVGIKLNQTPLSNLVDSNGNKYASPNEALKLLRASHLLERTPTT